MLEHRNGDVHESRNLPVRALRPFLRRSFVQPAGPPDERPERVAEAAQLMGLLSFVVTSFNRYDQPERSAFFFFFFFVFFFFLFFFLPPHFCSHDRRNSRTRPGLQGRSPDPGFFAVSHSS